MISCHQHCQRLFSFTTPNEKDVLEKSLQIYVSVKLRHKRRESLQEEEQIASDDKTRATKVHIEYLHVPQQESTGTQTD